MKIKMELEWTKRLQNTVTTSTRRHKVMKTAMNRIIIQAYYTIQYIEEFN